MASVKQRKPPLDTAVPAPELAGLNEKPVAKSQTPGIAHPSGREGHGKLVQILRGVSFGVYFTACCLAIFVAQLTGASLYWINREWYYAYMAMTKRYFAITTTVMTQLWGPVTVRISGNDSVAGQIHQLEDGGVKFDFPERVVLIANHQIYTDWLYLWWVGYANQPRTDGHIYIILKESLKYIPFISWGMMFYSFIFMSRKMATDQPRLTYRLNKLRQRKPDPRRPPGSTATYLDPMWLLLFPEGTNLSKNGRNKSRAWSAKTGLRDPEHVMLPRSTGTFFCLNELKGTLEWVYDCTVAYEGIPRGKFGEDFFGLSSTYFQGQSPKSVNFYWRRFRVSDMPLENAEEFGRWLLERWYEKDALMEEYLTTGRFPPMSSTASGSSTTTTTTTTTTGGATAGGSAGGNFAAAVTSTVTGSASASSSDIKSVEYVQTAVRTRYPWEILQVFTIAGIVGLMFHSVSKAVHTVGSLVGS